MKKIIFFSLILCVFVCIGYAVDPNNIEVRVLEVETMVKELPVKEELLKTKQYTGTIVEIMTQRIVDVNEVYQHAKTLNEKAVKVCEDMGLEVTKKEAVKKILDSKKNELSIQKTNNELIKAVHVIINDPNVLPEPNDPNYSYILESNQEFLLAVMEMCSPQ